MFMNMKNTTLTLTVIFFGIMTATAVQAVCINCYPGNAINWPKPVGAGSPTGTGTSTDPAHGGSGLLSTLATAEDRIRFTCPGSYPYLKFAVRKKSGGTSADYIVAGSAPSLCGTPPESHSNGTGFGATVIVNALSTISIKKNPLNPGTRSYELCVECTTACTGSTAQPSSAAYIQNQ